MNDDRLYLHHLLERGATTCMWHRSASRELQGALEQLFARKGNLVAADSMTSP